MSEIEAALERIAARRPRIIDLSLDRVYAALERLSAPHRALPPVFHVAGTNGKGSTIAFLRAILEAAGKSVHVYTSPHLVRYNERIILGGAEISDQAFIAALDKVDRAVGEEKLTYFETLTCAAFVAFAEHRADYLLLEVGLGGRLDATNVIEHPCATIVAPVDIDHQQFLGETIAAVAAEKAGIFRKDAPAVIGRQNASALAVLLQYAEEAGANAYAMGRDWDAFSDRGRFVFQDGAGLLDLDPPRLAGAHQFDNAGLAIAALRAANISIDQETMSRGISAARWPGRLQRLTGGPLINLAAELLNDGPEIWLDGGHNPHAGRALARAMADLEARAPRPLVLIAGMQTNKDASGFLTNFAGIARRVIAIKADQESAAPAQEIANAAIHAGINAEAAGDLTDAIRIACAQTQTAPRILICGSLYLAGEVLRGTL